MMYKTYNLQYYNIAIYDMQYCNTYFSIVETQARGLRIDEKTNKETKESSSLRSCGDWLLA